MCKCERTILLVNDRTQTLRINSQLFKRLGYRVLTAKTPERALAYAARETIHLAVIDVRLRDNNDPDDYSGFYLADDLPEEICLVMTTAQVWADRASLIERARQRDDQGRELAYDFKEIKDYDHEKLLKVVDLAFKSEPKIHIKPNLKLDISRSLSWETMVDQLKLPRSDSSNGDGNPFSRQRGVQILKNLSCRLFSPPDKGGPDLVKFLSTTPGYSPCTVAMVRPYYGGEEAVELAVKFGPEYSIRTEVKNFHDHVEPFIPRASRTQLVYGPVWSHRTGALAYDFVGTDVQSVESLRKYYRSADVTDEQLCNTLEHLFSKICLKWYEQRGKLAKQKRQRLDTLYRSQLNLKDSAQVKKLTLAFERRLKGDSDRTKVFKARGDVLEVQLKDKHRLPHPLRFCFESKNGKSKSAKNRVQKRRNFFPIVTEYARTHGDLHSGNVIVNNEGGAWLIDFFKTGIGHALRDFAELESDIKFTLMTGNLESRHHFERLLLRAETLNEPFQAYVSSSLLSSAQQRALRAIVKLRQLAFELTDISDTREYFMALLFYALKAIGGFSSGSSSRQSYGPSQTHALLSAAMICQRLSSFRPNKKGAIFLGHDYNKTYLNLIQKRLSLAITKLNYDVEHPRIKPGGNIWLRVAQMIEQTNAGFYEITTGNGNVYFELGFALGKRKPYFALIHKSRNCKRPPLLGGELLHEYSNETELKRSVQQILENSEKWEDWFFFLKPGFGSNAVKERSKSALLLVANTRRQHTQLAPLLAAILRNKHREVDERRVEDQINVEEFFRTLQKVQLVVGCLASDRTKTSRYANAEMALALGIAKGMGKKTIILQEKKCNVLTDLKSVTVTFRGAEGAAESLEREMKRVFPKLPGDNPRPPRR